MKDEMQLKEEYGLSLLRIHKKVDKDIIHYIMLKLSIYEYPLIHILFIIISSIGILILCNDFIPNYNKYKYLSNWLRYFTPFIFAKKFKITHFSYIIFCAIIFIICIFRLTFTIIIIKKYKHYHLEKFYINKENLIVRILNHIVYVSFSYIIEFLSFIYYIESFQNDFIIKKDSNINETFNKLFCVLNAIFIVIYNINNYFFISLANSPAADKSFPFRMNIPTFKLYILIIFQNCSLIHPLQYYLKEDLNKIWNITYIIVILVILIWIYIFNIKLYNYNNFINSFISFIGEFCFISIIFEIILFFLSINIKTSKELLLFTFSKIGITICLFFSLNKVYQKIMMKIIYKRIFVNPYNHYFDNKLISSVCFLREIFEQKNMKYLSKINEYMIDHQKQCSNVNCACKIIKFKANILEDDKTDFIEDLFKKFNYYIEAILIHFNYQKNFKLSILLAEFFHLYRHNSIMSYSILQTLFHYNYETLNKKELITIYELLNKYTKYIFIEKAKNYELEKENRNIIKLKNSIKEMELKEYFDLIIKFKKVIKYMINYSKQFLTIIKHKDNYEKSTIIKKDEIYEELKYIHSPYLNKKNLNAIINYLSKEIVYTSNIKKYISYLGNCKKLLPCEYLYKIFLFADFFWEGKIPDNLLDIFYSFTQNRNLYSVEINPEIYNLLENKYYLCSNNIERKYYLLFKYTKELKISYISESLSKKLNYKQSELIDNNLNVLLIKDLIEPHDNIIKYFFILQKNNILKDKHKYIFDKDRNMENANINSTFQIGFNKNFLILATVELEQKKNELIFYANNNLDIISINNIFDNTLSLSLALIKELKIDVKELLGIDIRDINKKYKNELKMIKNIREFKMLDTKEYILKNLFKAQNQNYSYHINNKYIIKEDNDNSYIENEEKQTLKEKEKNKNKIFEFYHNLFNNISPKLFFIRPTSFLINIKYFLSNLKKINERINSYEQDILKKKNIYTDYLKLTNNYNKISSNNNNMNISIIVEPRLIYDTIFYIFKIELESIQKIFEIKEIKENNISYELRNIKNENEELNSTYNDSTICYNIDKLKVKSIKENFSIFKTESKVNNNKIENLQINYKTSLYFKEKIKETNPSKKILCSILLLCIFVLLITCIITLNYQTSLAQKHDKIFNALYFNYYQRNQFIYLNSAILSIFFELLNISNLNSLEDNKDILHLIGKNIEESHQFFIKYYMDFKIELDEDFSKLYEPLISNKISVNWENQLFYNDYNYELALIVYRILDSMKHEFNDKDKIDCENFLLGKYLNLDRKITPVYGNFIKLIYYFYNNYYSDLRIFFLSLEDSFDMSLNNFENKTTSVYIIFEIISLISFLSFFIINIYFLIKSNNYIFQNILYMFVDFTQTKDYSFNNESYNLLIIKRISNFIILLNEFNLKNLESLKKDKEIGNKILMSLSLKYLTDEENRNNKKKLINKKISYDKSKNTSLVKLNSNNISNLNKNNNKELNMLNKAISILNNKEINNISNNSINNISNSRTNSSNLLLNTSIINNNSINNSLIHVNFNTGKNNNDSRKNSELFKNNKNVIKKVNKNNIFNSNELSLKNDENERKKITIEKVLFQTKIKIINSIKILIIIFIVFTIIFIIYYILKQVVSFLFVYNFHEIINDFKIITSQYDHIIRYWNHMKTLFILPNTTIEEDFDNIEQYFLDINRKVNYIYKCRIKRYKRISYLYNNLLSSSLKKNISIIDFCKEHKRCNEIKNSNSYLLLNGIESTINLYAKEISNYYKDFNVIKNNIKTKKDIIKNFIDERYNILSININHVIIYLEELVFSSFFKDEEDIVNNFYLKIKILNIVEICYCAFLNLFSILFVYNFITRIVSSVEFSSVRINHSIRRMKVVKIE